MHHRAKFRQNRSNRGRTVAIFRFFQDGGRRHLDFQNFKFLTLGTLKRYVTIPNFVEIGPNAAEISRFIDFSRWRPPPCTADAILDF